MPRQLHVKPPLTPPCKGGEHNSYFTSTIFLVSEKFSVSSL